MGLINLVTICFSILLIKIESTQPLPPFSCDSKNPSTNSFPFCNTSLPINGRVYDLVSRLTLDEKISQLFNKADAVPRLGIPYYQWWSEALHGVAKAFGVENGIMFNGSIRAATSFPQVILTAATFDVNLWYRIAEVIGTEARAIYNEGEAIGMTFWAPNINIFRDPRWGRGQETPGEDPLVNGRYAVSFVRGIQGDSFEGGNLKDEHLKVSACCKHFTAYDFENWKGIDRFTFDARVTKQDMADTYQPPFKRCVHEGRASGLMCAYNRVNGVPNCANYDLLTKTARGEWGFKGYITSDYDAVKSMYEKQKYAKSPEDAVADVLKAGLDVGTYFLKNHTKSAVEMGKVSESDIDRALHNLFAVRMRLGLFNGNPNKQLYSNLGRNQICTKEHQSLALEAARDGIVLLKNSAKLLPLSKDTAKSLALIGPSANTSKTLLGNYAGPPCKTITPLEGLQSYVKNIKFHQGCKTTNCTSISTNEVVTIAKSVDYVVLIVGLNQDQEREGLDRDEIELPGKQKSLITSIANAAKKPVVLVLLCGGPVDISFAKNDPKIGSILWAGYPGEAGGQAIAEIIFGDHNPGGRLPITWYPKDFIKIPMTDMRFRPDPSSGYPGRTYRFYDGEKVFEFGYGLSYSKYSYQFVSVGQNKFNFKKLSTTNRFKNLGYISVSDIGSESCDKAKFSAIVRVKNHGNIGGKHPVLLFLRRENTCNGSPMKQLVGFQTVRLNRKAKANVEFQVNPCEHFSRANENGLMIESKQPLPPFSCDSTNPSTNSFPFCNTSLPISQRVQDLVARFTLDEKISQLVNKASAVPRLGIPYYQWWSEALHGVAVAVGVENGVRFNGSIRAATSFPQIILTAATFDANLWYRIAKVIGTEARAIYNEGQAIGMTFWSPNINIFRDPRWGRGQETPGEDPLVTGKYAVSFVRGIQGDSFEGGDLKDEHLQVSACCKHLTAYDLDHWKGIDRFTFDAIVTKQDMADTYQPPFKSCVQEGHASGIMCAYNRVNGVPNCADYDLLTKTARGEWGFQGYITSDCDAVKIIYENQNYVKSPEDAVADVLKAGMDVNCGDYLENHTKSAVEKGKVSEYDIDRALYNLFSVRMRLGLFNGNPRKRLYGNLGRNQICTQAHQDLALEAARDGIVLLKNLARLLPLSKDKTKSLAVIGPNANVPKTLRGNYAGPPCKTITPLEGLKSYVKNVKFHQGCKTTNCTSFTTKKVVKIAKSVDYVVLIMGLDQNQEREDLDRDELVLPGKQKSLITSIAKAARKPIVLVLLCGGPVDISFAKNDPKIGSILWAGYPGEAGGQAIAEIIFGDHNPGGRLPITWYPKDFIKIPMTDMRLRHDPSSGYPGRTYRFYKGKNVFEFGYGLSYSNYSYKFVSVSQNKFNFDRLSSTNMVENSSYIPVSAIGSESCNKAKFSVIVEVKNQGKMAGKHPVLLFLRQEKAGNGSPIKHLVGFQTVRLNPNAKANVEFQVNPCEHFSRANEDGLLVIDEGIQYLVVGDEEYSISINV
ncbi:putative beta-D-xylosidase 7 [Forsythia ovata]|uniref:Beta-D-xylosidase 7 n=1 Tax=Forsythia ovata TaxID=205694 RepID=A0ABD1PVN7_9LAMI